MCFEFFDMITYVAVYFGNIPLTVSLTFQPKIIFKAESSEEKNNWMAALVMLNTKSMLERHLDVILSEEEKKHPLRFPPSDKYRFAEPNTDENIVYEEREKSNGIPLIKVRTVSGFHNYPDYCDLSQLLPEAELTDLG